jgi:UTP--glucose-1-phosphate uridylyltransferase
MDVYEEKRASVLGTMEVALENTNKYGICEPKSIDNDVMSLKGVVEKPDPKDAPSKFAIAGRYVLTPKIYTYLKTQNKGKGGEIQLTDAILRLMDEEPVFAKNMNAKRYDVGSKIDYIEAIIDRALQDETLKDDMKDLIKRKG